MKLEAYPIRKQEISPKKPYSVELMDVNSLQHRSTIMLPAKPVNAALVPILSVKIPIMKSPPSPLVSRPRKKLNWSHNEEMSKVTRASAINIPNPPTMMPECFANLTFCWSVHEGLNLA